MKRVMGIVAVCIGVLCMWALADEEVKYTEIGQYEASGGPKEIGVSQEVRYCRIDAVEGKVIISSILLREGEVEAPFNVSAALQEGDHRIIDLGRLFSITSLRVSHDGGGKYKISMAK